MKRTGILLLIMMLGAAFPALSQGVDTTKWFVTEGTYLKGDGSRGCQEAANAIVPGDGYLHLRVAKHTVSCVQTKGGTPTKLPYTDAVIYTKPFTFTYGAVAVRAHYTGTGTWPAVWMIGKACINDYFVVIPSPEWATSPEIDIAEYAPGLYKDLVTMRQNIKDSLGKWQNHRTVMNPGPTVGFHVYRLEWSPGSLIYKIDGMETVRTTTSVPSTPMFLVIGIGGVNNTISGPITDSELPIEMLVDYARVCSNSTAACGASDPSLIFDDEFTAAAQTPHGRTQGSVTKY